MIDAPLEMDGFIPKTAMGPLEPPHIFRFDKLTELSPSKFHLRTKRVAWSHIHIRSLFEGQWRQCHVCIVV